MHDDMTRDDQMRAPASSPCMAHELPALALGPDELRGLLNELLESERAGARGLTDLSKATKQPAFAELFRELAKDEGGFCVMLRQQIIRLGGVPSDRTGAFYDKLIAREGLVAQLRLLDRGQAAVVSTLTTALPRVVDAELHADLQDMLDVHVRNIDAANQTAAAWLPGDPTTAECVVTLVRANNGNA